jgi:phosphoribosylaminoimidazolecarboxamide formyltransferase/IMP cyclohydrolase
MAAIAEQGILPFELVVVNLYPFQQTVTRDNVSVDEAIEQIDIGGPTLIRAASKNHQFVTIACQRSQYNTILTQIRAAGATTPELRRELAGAAFLHTAAYDSAIAEYFAKLTAKSDFPEMSAIALRRQSLLRYGENPHQRAALYSFPDATPGSLVRAEKLHGKELSYNNLLDLDNALVVARSLPIPGVAVLKHNNPCGAGTGDSLLNAMRRAWDSDPVSAFGSVLGFNVPVDAGTADYLAEPDRFVEAIVAPDFTPEAFSILTTKPKWKANVRLLKVDCIEPGRGGLELRQVSGGMLCQTADDLPDDDSLWKVVTDAQPTDMQLTDLRFAWAVCRHVKSNAIVLVKDQATVGVGAGQMSRVDAVEIAIHKAGDRAGGSVLASDAFFPFEDSIGRAAAAGVAAVIQPGGSRRDDEVIAACNRHVMAMVFTGRRHFRH